MKAKNSVLGAVVAGCASLLMLSNVEAATHVYSCSEQTCSSGSVQLGHTATHLIKLQCLGSYPYIVGDIHYITDKKALKCTKWTGSEKSSGSDFYLTCTNWSGTSKHDYEINWNCSDVPPSNSNHDVVT